MVVSSHFVTIIGNIAALQRRYRMEDAVADLIELLQSSGPISLDELNMRVSESPVELVQKLDDLRKKGVVSVRGPQSENLSELTPEEIEKSAETVVELSRSSLRRSFAS